MRAFLIATLAMAASAIKMNSETQAKQPAKEEPAKEEPVQDESLVLAQQSVVTYFDGQSTAEVANSLLAGSNMLKGKSDIDNFMMVAAGEHFGALQEDASRYDYFYAELDQLAKEYEQTSRRLILQYAKIFGWDNTMVSQWTLEGIMTNVGTDPSTAEVAKNEYASQSDGFTISEFMDFLEHVDADPEDEHPDFELVREIVKEAEEILGLTDEILPEGSEHDEANDDFEMDETEDDSGRF